MDSRLASKENWSEIDWQFKVFNQAEIGILINYIDNKNYVYAVYSNKNEFLALQEVLDGKVTLLSQIKTTSASPITFHVKRSGQNIDIALNHTHIQAKYVSKKNGKFGFLLNNVGEPKTLFKITSLDGTLLSGDKLSVDLSGSTKTTKTTILLSLFVLFLLLISASFFLSILFKQKIPSTEQHLIARNQSRWLHLNTLAPLTHLFLSICIFAPFFFKGHILVSSSDNWAQIYPLFFYSKKIFLDIIQGKSLGLWNPLTFNGTPFFSNHWRMIYYPLNWPVFLFSDKSLFLALTFRQFIETFLIGLFSYGFFKIELGSKKLALFCSICYQLCSMLIFTTSVFPSISLYLSMTMFLYFLWSFEKRTPVSSFVFLTLSTYMVITSANVAFVFYGLLSLGAISIYHLLTLEKNKKQITTIFLLSCITGFLISAIRILGCLIGVLESNRVVSDYPSGGSRLMMLIRIFIPEVAGGSGSMNTLQSKGLQNFFSANAHSQIIFFIYFGIIAALLLIASFCIKTKGRFLFWKIYSLVAIASGLAIFPQAGILDIMSFPLIHHSYDIIIIPIGICTLVGHAAKNIIDEKITLSELKPPFWTGLLLFQAYIIVTLTYIFKQITPYSRSLFLLGIIWYISYRILKKMSLEKKNVFVWISQLILQGILLSYLLFVAVIAIQNPISKKIYLSEFITIPALLILSVLSIAIFLYRYHILKKDPNSSQKLIATIRYSLTTAIIIIPLIITFLIKSHLYEQFIGTNALLRTFLIDISFSHIKFTTITLIGLSLFVIFKKKRINKSIFFAIIIIVTMLDLLSFNLRSDNIAATEANPTAFCKIPFPYRDIDPTIKKQLDLINYRVDKQNKALLTVNRNIIFSIPSYTGTIGYLTNSFADFISHFGISKGSIFVSPRAQIDNKRFLDLSAVKYRFNSQKSFEVRNSSLARLNLFYNYETIIDSTEHIKKLRSNSFNIRGKILLKESLDKNIGLRKSDLPSAPISILSSTSDKLTAQINPITPAIVLFNDSYHSGWKAFVDGEETKIYKANYNFMAFFVDKGKHSLELRFETAEFFLIQKISILGLIVFIILLPVISSSKFFVCSKTN